MLSLDPWTEINTPFSQIFKRPTLQILSLDPLSRISNTVVTLFKKPTSNPQSWEQVSSRRWCCPARRGRRPWGGSGSVCTRRSTTRKPEDSFGFVDWGTWVYVIKRKTVPLQNTIHIRSRNWLVKAKVKTWKWKVAQKGESYQWVVNGGKEGDI